LGYHTFGVNWAAAGHRLAKELGKGGVVKVTRLLSVEAFEQLDRRCEGVLLVFVHVLQPRVRWMLVVPLDEACVITRHHAQNNIRFN
jgi:hypothetical protein